MLFKLLTIFYITISTLLIMDCKICLFGYFKISPKNREKRDWKDACITTKSCWKSVKFYQASQDRFCYYWNAGEHFMLCVTLKLNCSKWVLVGLKNFNILKSYFLRFEERRSPLALPDFSERRSRSRSLFFFRAPLALALAILGAPLASAAHRAALSNTLHFDDPLNWLYICQTWK